MIKKAAFSLLAAALSTVAGAAAAQTYNLDANHTHPSVEFRHLGVSTWRGKFNKTSGKVVLDRAGKTGTVDVTIDPSSIDFGVPAMNEHARGDNWFKVAQHPTITYKGKISRFDGDQPVQVDGELTMLGTTKPVTLKLASFKCIQHPMLKREMCGGDATATINRREFGLNPKSPDSAISDEVKLALQFEGLLDQ